MSSKPDYRVSVAVKAKEGDDKTFLKTCGVGWKRVSSSGNEHISVKIDLLPVKDWDGQLYLFPADEDIPF